MVGGRGLVEEHAEALRLVAGQRPRMCDTSRARSFESTWAVCCGFISSLMSNVCNADFNCSLGDWIPNPDFYPHGMKPVADAAHAAGMRMMLWFEVERACNGSHLASVRLPLEAFARVCASEHT